MAEELSVSMAHIVAHIGDGKRCWEEGEAVLKAKHIVTCGVVGKSNSELKIMALCAQTSCLRAKPHEIVVTVTQTGFKISCSCKAGQSQRCKHCVAVLLYLNRFVPTWSFIRQLDISIMYPWFASVCFPIYILCSHTFHYKIYVLYGGIA